MLVIKVIERRLHIVSRIAAIVLVINTRFKVHILIIPVITTFTHIYGFSDIGFARTNDSDKQLTVFHCNFIAELLIQSDAIFGID